MRKKNSLIEGIIGKTRKLGLFDDNHVHLDERDIKSVFKGCKHVDFHKFNVQGIDKSLDRAFDKKKKPKGIVIGINGNRETTIRECQEIVEAVANRAGSRTKIVWGAKVNRKQKGTEIGLIFGR